MNLTAESAQSRAFACPRVAAQWPLVSVERLLLESRNGLYKPETFYGRGTPILKMFNIGRLDGSWVLDRVDRIEVTDRERRTFGLQLGDVLVNRVNSREWVGKCAVVDESTAGSVFESKNMRLRIDDSIALPTYFAAWLNSAGREQIARRLRQIIGMATVNRADLETLTIPLPPLPEQHRIVALLDEAAALRRLRAEADRRTAALVPAIFHEMFGDPDDASNGWARVPLSQVVERCEGGKSLASDAADHAETRYRVLKISAVTSGRFLPGEAKPVPAHYSPPATHFVRDGDLLFSRANTAELVGATAYVDVPPPNLLLPDKLWRFIWKTPLQVAPLYIWALLSQPAMRRAMSALATGTSGSMKNISQAKLLSLAIPLPPLPLQNQFAERVTAVRALEEQQRAARTRLDALNAAMLARAFRGEL